MVEEISKMYPSPIELKFEKIYHPFLIAAKKKYCGYKYEHIN